MSPRELRLIATTLIVAILLSTSIAFFGTGLLWAAIVILAIVLAARIVGRRSGSGLLSSGCLCDRCKYNDLRYCSRPERPNATRCPEYKPR